MFSRFFLNGGTLGYRERGVGTKSGKTNIRSEKIFIKNRFLQLLLGSLGRDGLEAGVGL
jgi:hypothetical protein